MMRQNTALGGLFTGAAAVTKHAGVTSATPTTMPSYGSSGGYSY